MLEVALLEGDSLESCYLSWGRFAGCLRRETELPTDDGVEGLLRSAADVPVPRPSLGAWRKVFGVSSEALEQTMRRQSPFGHLKGWRLAHFIVKAEDDLRMEALAMQVKRGGGQ